MEEDKPVFTTRIVVGKRVTPTPVFRDEMETVVFGPFWNVPNSIKTDELLPSIREGGGGFFAAAAIMTPRYSRGTGFASPSARAKSIHPSSIGAASTSVP